MRLFRVTRAFGTHIVSCKGSDLLLRFIRATAGGSTIVGLVGRRFGRVRIIHNKDIKVRSVDVVREWGLGGAPARGRKTSTLAVGGS